MDFKELYKIAMDTLKPRKLARNSKVGRVAAVLLTDKGNLYKGVSVDAPCALGFCAETAAAGTMITSGESRIIKMIAVFNDGSIISPCGRCREFISQIHDDNRHCEVMLEGGQIVTIEELLPHRWDTHYEAERD